MLITLTRSSVIGVGTFFPQPPGFEKALNGGASKAGKIKSLNCHRQGETFDIDKQIGERLVALGSAVTGKMSLEEMIEKDLAIAENPIKKAA